MSDYTVVTVCSKVPIEPYYCLREWRLSLGEVSPLAISAIGSSYQGLGDKPKFVYRAIKEGHIKSKYIIFCDCFDLVFCTTPEEIIKRFLTFNVPLVFSSEKNCFPDDVKVEYDRLNYESSYKYLNSGFIVGETQSLLEVLEVMDVESISDDYRKEDGNMHHWNDQSLYQHIFLKQPVPMALDYQQILCNTLHSVKIDELDFSQDRIRNIETGSYPCAMHMNGSAKTDGLREPILSHLKLI